MPGGIENSKQFWAIQSAKPRSNKWSTLQLHSVGDPQALSFAGDLASRIGGSVRVVPSDVSGTPMGTAIPHSPKPKSPKTTTTSKSKTYDVSGDKPKEIK